MYKKIILIGLLLGICSPCLGTTIDNFNSISNECKSTCFRYLRICNIHMQKSEVKNAFTTKDDIRVTSGIVTLLSIDELRSVMYHEVAHKLLHHIEMGNEFYNTIRKQYNREPTPEEISNFKHQIEFDADHYACIMLAQEGKPIELDSALIKLYEGRDMNREWFSHPSANERIKRIREYKKQLGY